MATSTTGALTSLPKFNEARARVRTLAAQITVRGFTEASWRRDRASVDDAIARTCSLYLIFVFLFLIFRLLSLILATSPSVSQVNITTQDLYCNMSVISHSLALNTFFVLRYIVVTVCVSHCERVCVTVVVGEDNGAIEVLLSVSAEFECNTQLYCYPCLAATGLLSESF